MCVNIMQYVARVSEHDPVGNSIQNAKIVWQACCPAGHAGLVDETPGRLANAAGGAIDGLPGAAKKRRNSS